MSDSSAAVLKRLFLRLSASWPSRFSGLKPLSAREASLWFSKTDPLVLARWTNEKAHQGEHPNWRIPLYRVEPVCKALEASEAECDELMMARIRETLVTDPDGDLAVFLQWLSPLFEELAARPVLSADEQAVLGAFRRAKDRVAPAAVFPMSDSFVQQAEAALSTCVNQAFLDEAKELESDDRDELTPEARKKLRARAARAAGAQFTERAGDAAAQAKPLESATVRARQERLERRASVQAFLQLKRKERRQLSKAGPGRP